MKRLATIVFATLALSVSAMAMAQSEQVTVTQGKLSGTVENGVSVFRGIPFASPPLGDLRWAPPQPAAGWGGVRDASKFGAPCVQTLNPTGQRMGANGPVVWTSEYMTPGSPAVSEDCLYLNVWTPRPAPARSGAGLPVLVYLYGGGYNSGSGSVAIYDSGSLARKGVIVVNMNYRVGAFGFFAHPELTAQQGGASGNYGIQDQIAALQWVRANIAAFGGDAGKVTIAGQSAGGGSVLALMASPMAKGLFRGAIVMSAPGANSMGSFAPRAQAEQRGVAMLNQLKAASLADARALPTSAILAAGRASGPIADGRVIPASPSPAPQASDVPVIMGYTLDDLFASRMTPITAAAWRAEAAERYGDKAADFLKFYPAGSDAQASLSARRETAHRNYTLPIAMWVENRTSTAPVYAYLLTHAEPGPDSAALGAFHTSDVTYMFDALHLSPDRAFTAADRKLADQFSSYAANFVKAGNPNGVGVPKWAAMTVRNKAVMELGVPVQLSRAVPLGADAIIAEGKAPGGRGLFGGAIPVTPSATQRRGN